MDREVQRELKAKRGAQMEKQRRKKLERGIRGDAWGER